MVRARGGFGIIICRLSVELYHDDMIFRVLHRHVSTVAQKVQTKRVYVS